MPFKRLGRVKAGPLVPAKLATWLNTMAEEIERVGGISGPNVSNDISGVRIRDASFRKSIAVANLADTITRGGTSTATIWTADSTGGDGDETDEVVDIVDMNLMPTEIELPVDTRVILDLIDEVWVLRPPTWCFELTGTAYMTIAPGETHTVSTDYGSVEARNKYQLTTIASGSVCSVSFEDDEWFIKISECGAS